MNFDGMRVERDQVLRFRLAAQGLAARLPLERVQDAAAGGVADVPPGSAALALDARVEDLSPAALDAAFDERRLVRLYTLRGAVHVVAATNLDVFTTGALPADEEHLRSFLGGTARAWLDREGLDAVDALEVVSDAARAALDGRTLTRDELHEEWRRRLAPALLPWCHGCRSHHVSPMLWRATGLRGAICVAGRATGQASFARLDQWLGRPADAAAPREARAELVRRHLRWYGPSTATRLAQWAGIGPAQARDLWALVQDELAAVQVEGSRAWLLAADVQALASASAARGVRLLPPGDPFLQQRDREIVVPDAKVRRRVYTGIGGPGVVLRDGILCGLWRPRKKGRVLTVALEPFAGDLDPSEVEMEAARVAAHRGAETALVEIAPGDGA